VKTVRALLVTGPEQVPAMLSVDEASTDGSAVLTVNGVAKAPEDLPKGAFVKVKSKEMADQAALAGYFIQPPDSLGRRFNRIQGKLIGGGLLATVPLSLYWAVVAALELDLVRVLMSLVVGAFIGLLGVFWWVSGEDEISRKDAEARQRAKRFWDSLGSFRRPR